jgi:hypothetical protein
MLWCTEKLGERIHARRHLSMIPQMFAGACHLYIWFILGQRVESFYLLRSERLCRGPSGSWIIASIAINPKTSASYMGHNTFHSPTPDGDFSWLASTAVRISSHVSYRLHPFLRISWVAISILALSWKPTEVRRSISSPRTLTCHGLSQLWRCLQYPAHQ